MKLFGKKNRWLLQYTWMFLVGRLVFALILLLAHKAPIYGLDGYKQHFTTLGYISKAVRELLAGQGIKMVNFSLGQGLDVLTTLTYYGLTDPLNLLSAFFPEAHILYAYILINIVRTYITGLCYMAYARKVGVKDSWSLSCSAIVFVFSGYCIESIGMHLYFLNGALYLCLLLLGIECVLRDRHWIGYCLTVSVMILANFYFAYMSTVAAILYILFRLAARWRSEGLRGTARDGFTLLGGYLLGAALVAVMFLPTVMLFLGNARLDEVAGYTKSLLFYRPGHYARLLVGAFTSIRANSHWMVLNYSPIALFCILFLFSERGAHRGLKAALILCAAGLCVPLVGRVMNGNGYVSNRWCYVPSVFIALSSARMLPRVVENPPQLRRRFAVLASLYYIAALAVWGVMILVFKNEFPPFSLLTTLLSLAFALFFGSGALHAMGKARARRIVTGFLVLSMAMYVVSDYTSTEPITRLMDPGVEETYYNETVADALDDAGVYRVDQFYFGDYHAVMKDYMGASFYWSMVSSTLGNYYRDLGSASQAFIDYNKDLGSSAEMCAVSATKYFIVPDQRSSATVPYGFESIGRKETANGSVFHVYQNRDALPLGYAYDRALSESEYAALPVERRIQALLSCAICDGSGLPAADAPDAATEIEWQWGAAEGAERLDHEIRFPKKGESTVRIEFTAPEDGETWLLLEETEIAEDTLIIIETDRGTSYSFHAGKDSNFYYHRPVTAVCLGGGTALSGCTLSSNRPGTLRFKGLRVVSLPLSDYRRNVAARQAEAMQDVQLGNNSLKGSIAVGGERVLQIAVPYSTGWTARVNGQPAKVFRCGGMYMGIELSQGAHEIEMHYVTPGLRVGAAVSLAALILLIALVVISKRRAAFGERR